MSPVGYMIWGFGELDAIDQIAWLRDHGAESVGFHTAPTLAPDRAVAPKSLDHESLARLQDAIHGLRAVEIHAPFDNYDVCLCSPNPLVRKAALGTIAESIELAAALGARVVTVHSGTPRAPADRVARRAALADALPALAERAAEAGVTVAVEVADHFLDVDEFDLLDAPDCQNLGICLDTGHICFEAGGRPAFERYDDIPGCISAFGSRLANVHLHDFRFSDRRDHLGIGAGDLDIDSILAALLGIGYEGGITLELDPNTVPPEEVPAQIEDVRARLRRLGGRGA